MLHVMMVTSEMVPYAKTGGLADVSGALPAALTALGLRVSCVLPRYGQIDPHAHGFEHMPGLLSVPLGGVEHRASVYRCERPDGVTVYLLDAPALFDRPGLYGQHGNDYNDNDVRFGMLSRGAIELARRLRLHVDVFHAHDWQAALVPWVLRMELSGYFASVLTVHNLGYQGHFAKSALHTFGIPPHHFTPSGVEFHGGLNLLKAGLLTADRITTVSETYAREIQTKEGGFGLDGVLRDRSHDVVGIVNGVDYDVWDPSTDRHLPSRYSAARLAGKARCKDALREELGLEATTAPLLGIVSRIAVQKGMDLVLHEAHEWVRDGHAQLVVLGAGDPHLEDGFRQLAVRFPGRVAAVLRYDERLAHVIEAAADIFLMPSRYEPCGLNQIYSLRYGTIPVVRAVGGLNDTVRDLSEPDGTGVKFQDYDPAALTRAVARALAAYADRKSWKELMKRAMAEDFGWARSARRYADMYAELT